MTSQQVYDIVMEAIRELKQKNEKQDIAITDNNKHINKIYVIIGKMGVKMGLMLSIFTVIGSVIGTILIKYVFNF